MLLGYNLKFTFIAAIDKLASVETFYCYEVFNALSVSVRISEHHLGQWGATAGIVNDVLDKSLDVAIEVRDLICLTLHALHNREL